MKKWYLSLYLACIGAIIACNNSGQKEASVFSKENIQGETMGTTFSISYLDSAEVDFMEGLQQLLLDFNQSVSTYIPNSEISIFNQSDSLLTVRSGHFYRNFTTAKRIYSQSNKWFNPTVMPLVNYWGFGYENKPMVQQIDSSAIDSLLNLVQFEAVHEEDLGDSVLVYKSVKGLQLDFSAIAKGDAVDQVAKLLSSYGINNYYIEIGGEILAKGHTLSGHAWRTGIRKPQPGAVQAVQIAVQLKDLAVATSGNYENYKEDKETGLKYAHTINPRSGYPEKNSLLSASVFATTCAEADALATAFMAMGLDNTVQLLSQLDKVEAYLIYADSSSAFQSFATEGFEQFKLLQQ